MNQKQAVETSDTFFRFQVIQGEPDDSGVIRKTKSVGMAYLREGQSTYTLRLWTLVNEKFYLIPHKADPSRYLVMTREPNKSPKAKSKFFWNIVGNGVADSKKGVIALEFDLFTKPIYVTIYPENSAFSASLPEPDIFEESAA